MCYSVVLIKLVLPSLLLDQVARSRQGVQRDPLAPLDHPLLWALALQTHPVTVDKAKLNQKE